MLRTYSPTDGTLVACPPRRLAAILAVLASLGTLLLVDAQPAAAAHDRVGPAASFESANFPGRYIRHRYFLGEVTPLASGADRRDAEFTVRHGLNGNPDAVSFESVNHPGHYLRHHYFRVKLARNDGSDLFRQDASFIAHQVGSQWRFQSVNFGGHYIRHHNFELWLARDDYSGQFQQDSTWRGIPCVDADTPVTPSTIDAVESAIACLTNQERTRLNIAPLAVHGALQTAARAHSQDMVQRRYFDHNTPEGVTPCQRVAAARYPWTCGNENIAYNTAATANRLMSQWMASDGHRTAILNGYFNEIGVGVAAGTPAGGPGSAGGTATQNFGRRG